MPKLSKDRRDIYYRRAKEIGLRARSAFKLLHLNEEFNLFNSDVRRVVDCCAAPGSWTDYATHQLSRPWEIASIDLRKIAEMPGVVCIEGDITTDKTAIEVMEVFDGSPADLLLCDGAPDLTHMHDLDQFVQHSIFASAVCLSLRLVRRSGSFVAKIFRYEDARPLLLKLKSHYTTVKLCKPQSCRNSSYEAFAVATGKIDDLTSELLDWREWIRAPCLNFEQEIPFKAIVSKTEDWDSDKNYEATSEFLLPIQPPIEAAYQRDL
eukprot:GHVP01068525.1.p1 GENE.GHVP01068525.1~~GHVP01068525.1.p1  ORF type:complete len:265 (+),score=42.64 GHVP01068525.1:610-1404(+)